MYTTTVLIDNLRTVTTLKAVEPTFSPEKFRQLKYCKDIYIYIVLFKKTLQIYQNNNYMQIQQSMAHSLSILSSSN